MRKFTYDDTLKCCFLAYISSAVINNFIPLLFIVFQNSFGISVGNLGVLVVLNFTVQMLVDILGAKYADRLGYRKTIIIALAMSAVGLAALSQLPYILPPYIGLVCSVVLYAIGSGLLEVVISPITEALPTDGKEAAMTLLHSFYCWGHMLCVLVSTGFFVLFGIHNWRFMALIWAVIPFVTMLLFTKMPICSLPGGEGHGGSIGGLFRQKIFIAFFIIMLCGGAAELAMAQWASYFAEEGLGVSKTVGDLLGPCMFAICMGIARVFYSKMAHKLKLARFLVVCSVLSIVSYLLAALCKSPVIGLAACGLCGFAVGIMWPGTLSLAAATMPVKSTAMFALLAVGGDIGCAVGPELVAIGSSLFTIHGSAIKAGLLCAIIFPAVLIAGVTAAVKMAASQE
ncbi:MAG: MFS transporter [Clostridia bacterium]|nr:MFS transporter [Clostridia bacterium]